MVAGNNNAYSFVLLKYGDNATDTVTGMVIYPDDFSFADAGVDAMTFGATRPTEIGIDSWRALESFGCVFLPSQKNTAFESSSYSMYQSYTGLETYYWSSTVASAARGNTVFIKTAGPASLTTSSNNSRYMGAQVRLAQDL